MTNREPRFADGAPMIFAGVSEHYDFARRSEIPRQWERFAPFIGAVPGQIGPTSAFGVISSAPNGFDYMTAVHVSRADNVPEGLSVLEVPARRFAVFTHEGPVSRLSETLDFIHRDWIPRSGERPAGPPQMVEVYDERFDRRSGSGVVEIWLAIGE